MPQRLARWARILGFRADADDFGALDRMDLALGLLATWVVGMGRYWDDPGAMLLQHLGLGSVVYVLVLAALLWLVIRPLGPEGWSYARVVTFVALVSPPAILYAIPIERMTSLDTARSINAWFLAIVATWRVALLFRFLRVHARLSFWRVAVGGLLPLTFVVVALVALNLERAVFDIMRGRRGPGTPNDGAYAVLLLITWFALLASIPLLLLYLSLVVIDVRERRKRLAQGVAGSLLLFLAGASLAQARQAAPAPTGPELVSRLTAAAIAQTAQRVRYDGSYRRISYPGGDVPAEVGVCTDLVIRAYRAVGIDLQERVHEDMKRAFHAYPRSWGLAHPDSNIDHRRVPNLQVYLRRRGVEERVSREAADYRVGDLVTWMLPGNLPHIGLVTERRSDDGSRPLIVHNIGNGPELEDMLFRFPITGHYRYRGE